eukprot:scaffold422973_cov53-Attheya_sp.AAC.1
MQERASPPIPQGSGSGRTSFSAIFLDNEFLRRVPYEKLPIEGLDPVVLFLLDQERANHANDEKDTAKLWVSLLGQTCMTSPVWEIIGSAESHCHPIVPLLGWRMFLRCFRRC